jgi:hypothetical protein
MVREGILRALSDLENDHIAFRTIGVRPLGIASLERVFLALGYRRRDHFDFPHKHLDAYWYSPPDDVSPRVFISELRVDDLSPEAARILRSYTETVTVDPVDGVDLRDPRRVVELMHAPLWPAPAWDDYRRLLEESEFGAWVLCNRSCLNHYTIGVHGLPEGYDTVESFNRFLEQSGFTLNDSGGKLKVSADGKLIQSSTVAALVDADFADGTRHRISGSYVELAERRPLDEFASLPRSELRRRHRREGFEAASADRIFESTYAAQTKRRG